jgi:gamma-glutamyltranspeptidase/glutathione hydrolase
VLCVLCPDACGLGGDMFALVADRVQTVAINGAGTTPQDAITFADDGPHSVTVPGLAGGWAKLHRRWGRLPAATVLAPAIRLAQDGHQVSPTLAAAVTAQRARLLAHGAAAWSLLGLAAGDRLVQPELAALLRALAHDGFDAFYTGAPAAAIANALARQGGAMDRRDLARHVTHIGPALTVPYAGCTVAVQPPPTQGVLLGMALKGMAAQAPADDAGSDHTAVELTEAAFAWRDDAAHLGAALLDQPLPIDPQRAARRGGPRAYLHTAGVATADADGLVVSSLVSVFDDFGSCVFVPELGITLNNRAGGFTRGANAPAAGKRPVHTLAPALVRGPQGCLALATPGADGQVQTLLQVIDRTLRRGHDLASAIAAPRWRSEGAHLLIEEGHPQAAALARRGHALAPLPPGQMRFGAVACAGLSDGTPWPWPIGAAIAGPVSPDTSPRRTITSPWPARERRGAAARYSRWAALPRQRPAHAPPGRPGCPADRWPSGGRPDRPRSAHPRARPWPAAPHPPVQR